MSARPPVPVDVVREALVEPVPCPTCGSIVACRCIPDHTVRLDTMAERIVSRLDRAGLLHTEPSAPRAVTADDIEQAARWLAKQSAHPRYATDDDTYQGWRRLLDSGPNVEHAHAAAVRRAGATTGADRATLNAARDLLLGAVEARRADHKTGE